MPTSGRLDLQKRDAASAAASGRTGDSLRPLTTPARGLLDPKRAAEHLRLTRLEPSPDLAPVIGYFWAVEWSLPDGLRHEQRTASDASVHLVFSPGATAIFGVVRGRFATQLVGSGKVLGVKFAPGALRAAYGQPLARLTDRTAALSAVLGLDDARAEQDVLAGADPAAMARAAEALLRPVLPPPDDTARLVAQLVQRAAGDPALGRVEALAAIAGVGVRELQRIFREYVGVSPKWMLRRHRLQEVALRLATGQAVDLTRLANDLGYFDHAHLTRDFRSLTGCSPAAYRAANAGP